jgi:hypothetical protein
MKFKVTYYDVETGKGVTKNCVEIDYKEHNFERNFSFIPVDDPPSIYKSVIIDHPRVGIYQNERCIRIVVEGYQGMNDGGYGKTKTIIESVRED